MSEYYHVDGELVPPAEATVSVRDRGFMYGDAAFETVRAYGEEVFEWEAHADRLRETCERLGFADAMPSPADLRGRIDETLAANDLADAYVRLSVTRGVQPGKLTPSDTVDPTVVVIVSELPRGGQEGDRVWDDPATVETVDTEKIPHNAMPAGMKTHNYLNGILARLELDGADEALLYSPEGYVAEGAASNLFFVRDGILCTPATTLPLLPGVTRDVVLELARDADISVETGHYEPRRVFAADEVFLTNSTWEIRPVVAVDDHTVDVGPVTKRLQAMFDERVEELY
ncbi:aminotransferase class IV [Halovenus salina]|uniref:aminotransferase class IV n=1 Tax=Halovenus salina TaxID=1510225 RepID=UPI002260E852|nr:aminotransferase class IV [Halovenus salina]